MTGMLLDPASLAVFLTAMTCTCTSFALNNDMVLFDSFWQSARDAFLVWLGLILLVFLPAMFMVDTSDWNWPFNKPKKQPSDKGGPPRNQWPREMRFAYQ